MINIYSYIYLHRMSVCYAYVYTLLYSVLLRFTKRKVKNTCVPYKKKRSDADKSSSKHFKFQMHLLHFPIC